MAVVLMGSFTCCVRLYARAATKSSVFPPKTWVVGYFDEKTDGIMPRTKSGIPFEVT